jgi:hypothetical protein
MVLGAREEAQEWTALLRDMIADRPSQHRILCFEGVKHRTLCNRTLDVELNFRSGMRERSKVSRQNDANHDSV